MNNKLLFLIVIILSANFLTAEIINFSIDYLGLKVIDVVMAITDSTISVTAKSTALGNLTAKMDNYYFSKFDDELLPHFYQKKIVQKDYSENRIIRYERESKKAKRISFDDDDKSCEYPINNKSRDFFTALLFMRNNLKNGDGILWIDANKLVWKAGFQIVKEEILNTKIGKIKSKKVKISFQKISKGKKERSDMLTNNLVNEENELYFWFTADERKLPIKAVYSMKPFPVVWHLQEYQK